MTMMMIVKFLINRFKNNPCLFHVMNYAQIVSTSFIFSHMVQVPKMQKTSELAKCKIFLWGENGAHTS